MNQKQIYTIFALAATLSCISFVLLYFQNNSLKLLNNIAGTPLFSNFSDYKVKTIKIIKPDGQIVILSKGDNRQWVVASCFNYPADLQKISRFLEILSSIKIVQNVHANEEQLSDLQILSPKAKDKNSGTEITIFDNENNIVFTAIAGKKRIEAFGHNKICKGRYVYDPKTKCVFLVDESLDEFNYKSEGWANDNCLNMKKIKTIQLLKNNNEVWTITRPNINTNFLRSREKNGNNYNSENVDKIIATLASFKFESIADPSLTDRYTGLDTPYIVKIESFDNHVCFIYIGAETKKVRYVKIKHISNEANAKHNTNTEKEWIYLVTQDRISPLLQTTKELFGRKRKDPSPINKIYSSPIS